MELKGSILTRLVVELELALDLVKLRAGLEPKGIYAASGQMEVQVPHAVAAIQKGGTKRTQAFSGSLRSESARLLEDTFDFPGR